jgi:predicted ABC-type ATPase
MSACNSPVRYYRRRYQSGLVNFFDLYSPLADSWQLYDNSNRGQLAIVASKIRDDEIHIRLNNIWQKILESYNP